MFALRWLDTKNTHHILYYATLQKINTATDKKYQSYSLTNGTISQDRQKTKKTEIRLFYQADIQPIELEINGLLIRSRSTISVPGVTFDSKLQWGPQIVNVVKKYNKAKQSIYLIRTYFSKIELSTHFTANIYPIIYYNCDVWLIPSLTPQLITNFYWHRLEH